MKLNLLSLFFVFGVAHGEIFLGTFPDGSMYGIAGDVYAVDTQTLRIDNFAYLGNGPAGFFWIATESGAAALGAGRVATGYADGRSDNCNPSQALARYSSETVFIELEAGTAVSDIAQLSVWCRSFSIDFASIDFGTVMRGEPEGLTTVRTSNACGHGANPTPALANCEPLSPTLNLQWSISADLLFATFRLDGVAQATDYLSFGIPGPTPGDRMTGGDATVVRVDMMGMPMADDYFLQSQAACSSGSGACPDTDSANGGTNDNRNVSGGYLNGILSVEFTRPLTPSDVSLDLPYGLASQEFFFASGPLDARALVTYHGAQRGLARLELGRAMAADNCPALTGATETPMVLGGWKRPFIANTDAFVVRMGASGGARGFAAITGQISWGIAMYVNDVLIPVVAVERGRTYNWTVQTGADVSVPSEYHPFYITDSPTGGYAQRSEAERAMETIYFGVDAANNPSATGPFCSYRETEASQSAKLGESYAPYFQTLSLVCEGGEPDASQSTYSWTVPADAPDTLYYECYTHERLGFRIRVFDQGAVDEAELDRLSEPAVGGAAPPTAPPVSAGFSNAQVGVTSLALYGYFISSLI